jgi:predicted nuclease of predicted toxin-antitoxin system
MPKFLIDVNLPYRFKLWHGEDFVYVRDMDERMSDSVIWKYARENGLTIVTKDSDFSNRILSVSPPPRVIQVRFGNLKMQSFEIVVSKFWDVAVELSKVNKVVFIYSDRVECIQ